MSWHPATTPPTRRDRYLLAFRGGTIKLGWWSPDRGFTDGLTKLNAVWKWCEIEPL